MPIEYIDTTATITGDMRFLISKREKPENLNALVQNAGAWAKPYSTAATIGGDIIILRDEVVNLKIPNSSAQYFSTSLGSRFEEEIGFAPTQDSADTPYQHLAFPSYDEEDILDWDVAIVSPPPRPSGTIRVKLKYGGRSKPLPIDNFGE